MEFIKIGDCVAATRIVCSSTEHNLVVGPVENVFENSLQVMCNKGTSIERNFILPLCEWRIWKIPLTT